MLTGTFSGLPESLVEMGNGDGVAHPIRARGRSTTKLRELYVALGPEAGRLAYLLVGDAAAAQDIAQEACSSVPGFAVAQMLEGEVLRPNHGHQPLSRALASPRAGASTTGDRFVPGRPGGPCSRIDQKIEMIAALQRLPVRQRTALVLRYYEDLSEYQTADLLGCPVGTVKSSVSRALQTLRMEFEGERDG